MSKISTVRVRHIIDGGARTTAEIREALTDYLGYREGFSPAERLPEDGEYVLLKTRNEGYAVARLVPGRNRGEVEWGGQGSAWKAALKYAERWYPLPGGDDGE